MKFNFSKIFYLLFALPIFFASCSKEGPAGATGPAGPQGPTGATGAAGATGAQGNPGTANVIYSDWLDVTYSPNTDSSAWIAEIDVPQLVDSILNKGEIKVYFNIGSDSAESQFIYPLPIYDAFIAGVIINPYFSTQTITLVASADASSYTDNGNNYLQYRYILIPGGTAAGRNTKGDINWNNYAEVKKYLGLKD